MQAVYTDLDGNIVDKSTVMADNLTSACAGNLPDYTDINGYSRLYLCNTGYKIFFTWTVSWDNNIVYANPTVPTNQTKGTIKISTTANPNAYTNTTTNVNITDMGVDPANPANNIFVIKMTSSTFIPESVVNAPGALLRLGASFATDCATLDYWPIALTSVTGLGIVAPLNNNPCSRNDRTFFTQPGIAATGKAGVMGYDPLSLCSSYTAGTPPSYQETQYNLNNGTGWKNCTNTVPATFGYSGSRFIYKWDTALTEALVSGSTYNITIRFRNWTYNAGTVTTGFPMPTTSNSCFNPDWTVEQYNNVYVP